MPESYVSSLPKFVNRPALLLGLHPVRVGDDEHKDSGRHGVADSPKLCERADVGIDAMTVTHEGVAPFTAIERMRQC